MSGIENLETKKMRIFKFDDRAEIKNFYFFDEKAILVMGYNLGEAFVMSSDGRIKRNAEIVAPSNNYLQYAPHALVKNELFIFGGMDAQKIAKLDGCTWRQQPTRLINKFTGGSAALSIEDGQQALICFDWEYQSRCEIFGGDDSIDFSTKYQHWTGGLGFYQGKPTTVGGYYGDGQNKIETLVSSGRTSLPDFPKNRICNHVLMGLPSGSLLLAGGVDDKSERQEAIWLLENDIWKHIGNLANACSCASAIIIENSIFIVPGWGSPYTIEQLDLRGDRLINQRVVGNTDESWIPVLLEVPANYCV